MSATTRIANRGYSVVGTSRHISSKKDPRMSATVLPPFSRFRRVAAGLAASLTLGALSALAAPTPFPADFRSSQVVNADATINVRVGGYGPAVVLIHGFGETGDMWSPMAADGDERAGSRRAERRPLADGRSARGDDRRLPRSALSPAAASRVLEVQNGALLKPIGVW
jgi:hypothetical protein